MANGRREFKAKAKLIAGHIMPALHDFRSGQGVKRGIALNAVKVLCVIGKGCHTQFFPLGMLPLWQSKVKRLHRLSLIDGLA